MLGTVGVVLAADQITKSLVLRLHPVSGSGLVSVQLVDVAPVLDPAYPDSTAAARALNGAVESLANWVQAEPEEVRSRLGEGRAMTFFKRTDNTGPVKRAEPKKPVLTGAQALLALQVNMEDPYVDEG